MLARLSDRHQQRRADRGACNRDEFIFNHTHNPAAAPLSYNADSLDQGKPSLTVRQREKDSRAAIPASRWRYLSPKAIEIERPAGFDAGAIYEFIYPARDPIVMGLGFAAMRDAVSFFRRRRDDDEGRPNPLNRRRRRPVDRQCLSLSARRSPDACCAITYGKASTRTWRAARFSTA